MPQGFGVRSGLQLYLHAAGREAHLSPRIETLMFAYITFGAVGLAREARFYAAVLAPLGLH